MGAGTPVLFAHATGFHGRIWTQVIRQLAGRRVIAVDLRGHGLSSKPAGPYRWMDFGEDVAELARLLKVEGALGVGHSMGGHSLVVAAAEVRGAFSSLLLLDPVILEPSAYGDRAVEPHFARKRKNSWFSANEMFERFKDRAPFRDWDPAVLRDYCEWGLARRGDDYVLACPPEVEASIYEAARAPETNPLRFVAQVEAPVLVVRGAREAAGEITDDLSGSPTDPRLASRFKRGRDLPAPYSHYIPMESPGFVAELLHGM